MNIDINKVNLTEKDIEDWLYENPSLIRSRSHREVSVDRWFARQYRLPNGIADLIGIHPDGRPIVIEVKNVPITKAAVLQVCRYASDVDHILEWNIYPSVRTKAYRLLIGPAIDFQTAHEAWACNVHFLAFTCNLNVILDSHSHDKGYESYYNQIHDFSLRPEWGTFDPPSDDTQRKYSVDEPKDKYDELMDAIADDAEARDGDE